MNPSQCSSGRFAEIGLGAIFRHADFVDDRNDRMNLLVPQQARAPSHLAKVGLERQGWSPRLLALRFTLGLPRRMSHCWIQGIPRCRAALWSASSHRISLVDLAKLALSFLPLGNAAWQNCDLQRPDVPRAAVGLCAALLSNIQGWCYGERLAGRARFCRRLLPSPFSLMLAFSQSNVVAGRHRGSLRTACSSDRRVSHSVLFMGAPSRE